ncbi:hypothetical protein F0562_003221 [Nyssa sinensis]|uniref:Reverse transcriptase RNase H-like domain-containing protein n=1 Tax=Nyssa sinensis TaxID=561372 RepID=A0A5J5BYT7_9ASTE|nr:hypothetical protein F0562_003221 [Nyssa sinensis]
MASNKERIEALEAGLGGVQDGMQRLELGVTDKLRHLEETINKLSEALLSTKEPSNNNNNWREGSSCSYREENDEGRQINASLKYLMEQRIGTPDQQNWVAKLLGYNYEILYRPGRENPAADALSRVSGSPINALFVPHVELWEDIKSTAKAHPYMDHLCQLAHHNPGKPYSWRTG